MSQAQVNASAGERIFDPIPPVGRLDGDPVAAWAIGEVKAEGLSPARQLRMGELPSVGVERGGGEGAPRGGQCR